MVPNKIAIKYDFALKKLVSLEKFFLQMFFFSDFSKLWNILSSLNTFREVTPVKLCSGGRL